MSISEWREKSCCLLIVLIQNENLRKNIEISIYNWSFFESKKGKWLYLNTKQKDRLLHLYRQKMRSILFNLRHNNKFMLRVQDEHFDFKRLPYMSPETIHPVLWSPVVKAVAKKHMRRYTYDEKQYFKGKYECTKCDDRISTLSVEMQTRSEVENIISTFVFCKYCNNE
jgi:hypothetical protein